jgi:REP element-mobilizing transposase RayT
MNEWELHELNIQKDHVHMLIQINPRESLAKVVQILKGGTSFIIRKEYPELEEFLWRWLFCRECWEEERNSNPQLYQEPKGIMT